MCLLKLSASYFSPFLSLSTVKSIKSFKSTIVNYNEATSTSNPSLVEVCCSYSKRKKGVFIMKLFITARNFDLTQGLKDAIENKLSKFEKFIDESQRVQVTMEVHRKYQKIEIMFYLDGTFVKEEVKDEDLYTALDVAVDNLKYKLSRFAFKRFEKEHENKGLYVETDSFFPSYEDVDEPPIPVIKRKQFNMKPMHEEEAILQMEMLGHEFFMFFNAETETMCLLYKRKDGNYGLIEGV